MPATIPPASLHTPFAYCSTWLITRPTSVPCRNWSHSLSAYCPTSVTTCLTAPTAVESCDANAEASAEKLSTTVLISSAICLISSWSSSVRMSQISLMPVIGSQIRDSRSTIAACVSSIWPAYVVSWLATVVVCDKIWLAALSDDENS